MAGPVCSGCLVATVVAGLGWLAAAFVLAYLHCRRCRRALVGIPAPTVLVLGGVLAGCCWRLGRIGVEVVPGGGRRSGRPVLRAAIAKVTGELVVAPVRAEQERYEQARQALERADPDAPRCSRSLRHSGDQPGTRKATALSSFASLSGWGAHAVHSSPTPVDRAPSSASFRRRSTLA